MKEYNYQKERAREAGTKKIYPPPRWRKFAPDGDQAVIYMNNQANRSTVPLMNSL